MSFKDRELVVGVPNLIIQQYLGQRYRSAVAEAVGELLGEPVEVKFDVAPRLFRQMRARRQAEQREVEAERVVVFRPLLVQGFNDSECQRSGPLHVLLPVCRPQVVEPGLAVLGDLLEVLVPCVPGLPCRLRPNV